MLSEIHSKAAVTGTVPTITAPLNMQLEGVCTAADTTTASRPLRQNALETDDGADNSRSGAPVAGQRIQMDARAVCEVEVPAGLPSLTAPLNELIHR